MTSWFQRRNSSWKKKSWLPAAIVVAGLLGGASESDAHMEVDSRGRALEDLIKDLVVSAPHGQAAIEQVTGVKLSPTSSGFFNEYEGHSIRLHDVTIQSIEVREPGAGIEATSGSIIVLTLGNGCVGRGHVFAHYPRLKIIDEPRVDLAKDPSAVHEVLAFATDEPWGRLSFGFSGHSPNCVATVTIAFKKL